MHRFIRILKNVLFLLLLSAALFAACRVTQRKESVRKYADLYEAAPYADVLFLGSSHVINGVNPVQLYEEYGVAAYNLGGHGSILPASYYELLCALDYFSPQLVVIDGYLMDRDYHYLDEMTDAYTDEQRKTSVSQLHLNLDVFPLSRTKLHAVRDLIADRDTRLEFLFPFRLYHNRWSALAPDDFRPADKSEEANRLLGAEIRTGVDWRIAPHTMGDDVLTDDIHLGEQYLQMILQTCRERGIDVALTFLPCNATALDRQTAARLEAVAAAENLPYMNFLTEEVVDPGTDFSDEGHLNLWGMTKVTRRIGAFLADAKDLPDRREDPAYALWAARAADALVSKVSLLRGTDTLSEALLVLAADPTLDTAVLYLSGGGAAIGDPAVKNLLDALVPDNNLRGTAAGEEPALLVLAPGEDASFGLYGYQVTDWQETALGPLDVIQVENFTGVYVNGDETDNLLDMEENRLADAQLVLSPGTENQKRLIFYYRDDQ